MSRLRRIDRAILSEGADSEPLDTDDQEQLLTFLAEQNDSSLKFALRFLIATILVEIPISVFVLRHFSGSTGKFRSVALLLVSHILTLINCLYEFKGKKSSSSEVDSLGVERYRSSGKTILKKLFLFANKFFSFYSIFALNTIVLLQLLHQVYVTHGFRAIDTILVLPVVNAVAVAYFRKGYGDISREIHDLHGLKYKFKTA